VTSSLEIQINSAGLSEIYNAGQTVTLARQVDQVVDAVTSFPIEAGQFVVAWLAFAPLQNNTVSWAEEYYCFATTTPLIMAEVIEMNSQSGAAMQVGSVYAFTQGQFVAYPSSGNSYVVYNAMAASYGLGLAQQATVNNLHAFAPIAVDPVLSQEAAYFAPEELVSIFLSSAQEGGTIVPFPINALSLTVEPGDTGIVVGFNNQTSSFFQLS
jgi:hypothetical protein